MNRGRIVLNVGDKVFVSQYGGGIVAALEEREIMINKSKYVIIYFFIDDMELSIPENKIENYGVRFVCDEEHMNKALERLQDKPNGIEAKWSKRYMENNKKIDSGNLNDIIEVIRDLQYLKKNEVLPSGEQKILDRAKKMLGSEMMVIFNISLKESLEKIEGFSL